MPGAQLLANRQRGTHIQGRPSELLKGERADIEQTEEREGEGEGKKESEKERKREGPSL